MSLLEREEILNTALERSINNRLIDLFIKTLNNTTHENILNIILYPITYPLKEFKLIYHILHLS